MEHYLKSFYDFCDAKTVELDDLIKVREHFKTELFQF
jgi:hypothetical protein